MKILLVIFAICLDYTLGEGTTQVSRKVVYPKKYRSYINGKILINAAKYETTKNPPVVRSYTVFQLVGSNPKLVQGGVPDSPYFPVDQGYDQKVRVKKILPLDYPWSILRNKRSAVLNVSSVEKDDKKVEAKPTEVEKVKETTPTPTAAAVETTAIKSSSHKEVQEETKSTTKISTTKAKATIDNTEIKRAAAKPAKKNNPVRKGKSQPKSNAAPKKNSGRVNRNSKSKPKGKGAAAGRAQLKEKQNKSAKKPIENQEARKKDKKRKGNTQRSKKQKAKPNKARAGKTPKDTRRLIGAREALIEDYPYVVSIQKDDQHWCSGALLNERLVITTANCLWKANHISRMEVRAGSRHSNRGGQMANIEEVIKHPGWGLRKNPDYDVALLLLDKFIRFSDAVHGVDLPNRVMLPPFDDAWITSWGSERFFSGIVFRETKLNNMYAWTSAISEASQLLYPYRDGVYDHYDSTSLQVYHARLIDREKCNNVTMRFSVVVTENFICLAQSGRQAPCTRDTGAPAVSDGILWGLASWGIRKLCGTERYPAVFSYLASHSNMEFIMNATRFLMSDKRQYPFADRYPGSLMSRK